VTLVAKGSMTKLCSILRTNADLEFYVGGVPHVRKVLVVGQSNGSF
jgi:hypothetical protein